MTFHDANHCPGAAVALFNLRKGSTTRRTVLHTGDFRWHRPCFEVRACKGREERDTPQLHHERDNRRLLLCCF